jgi:hypothetical protein
MRMNVHKESQDKMNVFSLQDLHCLIGLTILLNTSVGAGGAEGAGYWFWLFLGLRHILQQQRSRSKLTIAPPIIAPDVVNFQ